MDLLKDHEIRYIESRTLDAFDQARQRHSLSSERPAYWDSENRKVVAYRDEYRFTEEYVKEGFRARNFWALEPDEVEFESQPIRFSGPSYKVKGIWNLPLTSCSI